MAINSDQEEQNAKVSITPLLRRLWPSPDGEGVTANEIAYAIAHIFTDSLSPVQTGALLTALHFTGWDRRADVVGKCAAAMRYASSPVDTKSLAKLVKTKGRKEGNYRGGLCDIVGTGGDSHNTFNISTTSSILASSLLMIAKHGNRASTSKSGSADLLSSTKPNAPVISAVTPSSVHAVYESSGYCFLFAPVFHPGARFVAPIRKELGWRTIFNLLGPLANPLEDLIEARVIGVARKDMGGVFAEALQMAGAKKALVVCGEEDLDEISIAGRTLCWQLVERPNPDFKGSQDAADDDYTTSDDDAPPRTLVDIEHFMLEPADFGLPRHPLSQVSPGKEPEENALILMRILRGEIPPNDPILHFVLINTAALFVASGLCDSDSSSMGEGDDGNVITETGPGGRRWKEGLRRARWAVSSGAALQQWHNFTEVTNQLSKTT
ncbi:anthranilate phosphoribosyltransferas-like protein [Pseudovirgaria hyperparasitica]|uniref:Anthranilate phosphoribosyltransferas-like protein n=1 Tax=Pseudovirgaria hyperparasitica TaxID=470096 RepID=A0A6A6WII5_9PEZI|nr:anthranilate phosphoribosyltransferas-like protein [Pseudovirgaria hyperparasitica]KAF2761945.1 anthranilate phosphoribosyltransferas-like protein [Pseudovirgaria hyperparasitica]